MQKIQCKKMLQKMENKKEIGKIFKEKFKDLDEIPSDLIWNSIEKDLDKKKKRRFLTFCFLGFLCLLGTSAFLYFNQNETIDLNSKTTTKETNLRNKVGKTEFVSQTDTVYKTKRNKTIKSNSTKKLIATNAEYDEYEIVTRYKVYKKSTKTSKIITRKQLVSKKKTTSIIKKGNSIKTNTTKNKQLKNKKSRFKKQANYKKTKPFNIPNQVQAVKKDTVIDLRNTNLSLEKNQVVKTDSTIVKKDSISKKKNLKPKKEVEKQVVKDLMKTLKLYLTVYGGKNYFDDFNRKSGLISGNQNIKTSGDFGYNFGVLARVMISKKIGFRTGIGYSVWNYNTTIQNTNSNNWILEQTNIALYNLSSYDDFNLKFVVNNEIKLSEKLNYYEIPVECYYIISDNKKIGIDAFAGISTHFMQKTKVFATSIEGQKIAIGKATNEVKIMETLNIGLVFNYPITKKLKLEITPIFKNQFQIQKINNDFKASTFNANAGLTYKIL
jgi:hypothetical protein